MDNNSWTYSRVENKYRDVTHLAFVEANLNAVVQGVQRQRYDLAGSRVVGNNATNIIQEPQKKTLQK